jgi:hypothetical protein
MPAVVRSKVSFMHASRRGLCVALVAQALACGADDDDAGPVADGGNAGKTGSSTVMSDFPDAQSYVDAHNAVRAAVRKPTTYAGTWAPVPPVTWSDKVAASAQQWVNHLRDTMGCGLMHGDSSGYGENLAAGSNLGAQQAVDMWASEIENYTYSPAFKFQNDTGHYTQIVWRKTTAIGCASAQCSGSNVISCRYDPPGNFVGEPAY